MQATRDRAPAWLDELRSTDEWRLAHTALDEDGRPVVPEFDWARGGSPSFARFIASLAERFGPRVAIVDYSGARFSAQAEPSIAPTRVTYADLASLVQRRAASLHARGIGPWDHLALCLPNCLEVLALQYAAWSLGAIVSPINPDQKDRIDDILHSADQRLVVVERDCAAFASAHRLDPARVLALPAGERVDGFWADPRPHPNGHARAPASPRFEDPVVVLYTSGTTGQPKGAMLSPYGLLTGALAIQEGFALAADDRFMMVNPLYHINSIAFALAVLGVGGQIVIPPFGQHWATAAAAKITTSSMVQRHLTPLLNPASPSDRRNLQHVEHLLAGGTLKWIAVGSGPLAPDVQAKLLDMGMLILFRWGMSENHLGSTNMRPGYPLDYYRSRLGSTGPTNRFLNLFVLDDEGRLRRQGRGRLVQRGNVLVAYSTPEASAGAFLGGYHDTGDLAEITAEGHVYIVGRTKETIIRSGENVYPQDVDNYLMRHPRVVFAHAVGYPDPDHSEEVGAFVVVDDESVSEHEILDYAAGLGIQKRPKKLVLLRPEEEADLLRYTGPGKPQRLVNQLTFWRMHYLDESGALLVKDGRLPVGSWVAAMPDSGGVGLLVCVPDDVPDLVDWPTPLDDYLVRASRLGENELRRVLGQRKLSVADLHPSRVRLVRLSPSDLAEARTMSRVALAAKHWIALEPALVGRGGSSATVDGSR